MRRRTRVDVGRNSKVNGFIWTALSMTSASSNPVTRGAIVAEYKGEDAPGWGTTVMGDMRYAGLLKSSSKGYIITEKGLTVLDHINSK